MNPSLIVALILAFGLRLGDPTTQISRALAWQRAGEVAALALVPALIGAVAGYRLRQGLPRVGGFTTRARLSRYGRWLSGLSLGLYATALHAIHWPEAVEQGFGLRDAVLLDEALILGPFLLYQLAGWLGFLEVENACRPPQAPFRGAGRLLLLRARGSYGLILPASLAFAVVMDALRLAWPALDEEATSQLVALTMMAGTVLALAPGLVRLAWPTASLPAGPLRDRLTKLARRLGFRYTDILVWDTDHTIVNAGVTGALPWYRYVLLTDALIETLDEEQIEAVFGHEVGHVAHRHLAYFGFFFLGSMGLMALVGQGVSWLVDALPGLPGWAADVRWSWTVDLGAGLGWLAIFALYVLLVFGFLSRRFERQADVFGCRAVSCGRADCPPHERDPGGPNAVPAGLCPIGIQTFAAALTRVALLNGMEPRAGSWRHGSIRDRVAFLEGLAGQPEQERRFQGRVRLLRLALTAALLAMLAVAIATGALEQI